MKKLVCALIAVLMSGCATAQKDQETMIQEAVSRALRSYYNAPSGIGKIYPEPHKYVWDNQILEEIVVPGAIRGGVFYPAHRETIVVKPYEPLLIPERESRRAPPGGKE
ncbi:MAG: hypothetical protein K8I29_19270 [Alphaproteobacteria bacterium]|uniref:Uncharacterized protein n=1 Tax=Candidatus Nitrobium versatile TaxID=2884831 RepID=A0A953M3J8_9BACT|nr:hypothetical protein [Candidatus Nitrobium versatile]